MTERQPALGLVVSDLNGEGPAVFKSEEADRVITVHLVCSDCNFEEDVPLPADIATDMSLELDRLNLERDPESPEILSLPGLRCPPCAHRHHIAELFGPLADLLLSEEGLPFDEVPDEGLEIPLPLNDPWLEDGGEPPF